MHNRKPLYTRIVYLFCRWIFPVITSLSNSTLFRDLLVFGLSVDIHTRRFSYIVPDQISTYLMFVAPTCICCCRRRCVVCESGSSRGDDDQMRWCTMISTDENFVLAVTITRMKQFGVFWRDREWISWRAQNQMQPTTCKWCEKAKHNRLEKQPADSVDTGRHLVGCLWLLG